MNWGELKSMARATVPYAQSENISDTILELVLYNGVKDIAARTKCLPENLKFNITAETGEYLVSTVAPRFLLMDKPGLWWYDGTDYKQLDPKTRKWLDENIPNWRTEDSDDPIYYYQEKNVIGLYPKPNTTTSSGIWIYYFAKPAKPTADSQYPFEGTVEIPMLSILDGAIINYFRWKVLPFINKDDEYNRAENQYKKEVAEKIMLLNRKPDISAARDTKLQGRIISR